MHRFHPLHKNNIFKSFTAIISDVSEIRTVFTFIFSIVVATTLSPSSVQLSYLTVRRILNAVSPLCLGEKKEIIQIFHLMLSIFNTIFHSIFLSETGKNGTRRICG